MLRYAIIASVFLSGSVVLAAEVTVNPLLPPEHQRSARNYDVAIFGIRPGMTEAEAISIMEGRGMTVAREPNEFYHNYLGERLALKFTQYLRQDQTFWNTDNEVVGTDDGLRVYLDTGVNGGRVIAVQRHLSGHGAAADAMPNLRDFLAQITQTYGQPSEVREQWSATVITYGWSGGAFIPDLAAQDERGLLGVDSKPGPFSTRLDGYKPCVSRARVQPVDVWAVDDMPDCDAILQITYNAQGASKSIRFTLIDYELSRWNREETIRQMEGAADSAPSASNLDL